MFNNFKLLQILSDNPDSKGNVIAFPSDRRRSVPTGQTAAAPKMEEDSPADKAEPLTFATLLPPQAPETPEAPNSSAVVLKFQEGRRPAPAQQPEKKEKFKIRSGGPSWVESHPPSSREKPKSKKSFWFLVASLTSVVMILLLLVFITSP